MLPISKEQIDLLSDAEVGAFSARQDWLHLARPEQLLPPGKDWDTAAWIGGRMMGKTRTLVEAGWWEAYRIPNLRVHAVSPTQGDIRKTIFEGPSGFMNKVPRDIIADYNRSFHELTLTNGSKIFGFSSDGEGDRLRGPACHLLLCDEMAAWNRPPGNMEAAYKAAVLGCREPYPDGTPARKLIATTPKPIAYLKNLLRRPGIKVIHGTSYDNLRNLSPSVRSELLALEGTSYGKQELAGLFIDEESDQNIFKRHWFKLWPAGKRLPEFSFVLEVYDTAYEEENFDAKQMKRDPTACIVLGVFNVNQAFTPEERKALKIRPSIGKAQYAVLLCDAWSEYLEFPDLLEKARAQHRIRWGTSAPGSSGARRADICLIEDKASGKSLRQTLTRFGVPCWPYNPNRESKTMRAHAASPIVAQGLLFIPESARPDRRGMVRDWAEPFMEQVCAYAGPGTTEHDDYLDTLTSALSYLRDRSIIMISPKEEFVDYEERLEKERQAALAQQQKQNREKVGNPYAS